MPQEEYYPPTGFYFEVKMMGAHGSADIDASFQEVSGIEVDFNVEEVVEGGENRFVHRLPRPAKYPNLALKRGVITRNSPLAEWIGETIGSNLAVPIVPRDVMVTLLSENGNPTISWSFTNACPIKWDVGPLNSNDNKILTETLEFTYNYFERINLPGI